jgi:2-iminobutanoate/2-iminopropanoate deaminase
VGHYSHATVAGGVIFVSGLLALDEAGGLVGAGDAGAQAAFIFDALVQILAAAGASLGDVAKLNLYLIDLDDRGAVNLARREAFGDWKPASTLVQVAGLIGEGTLVEIEAVAVLPLEASP